MKELRASRQIHSSANSREIPDLLQCVFVGELLSPSTCVWIVSPWISDIPVLNNETNSFSQLIPDSERLPISLSKVIARMLSSGTTIHVATRDVDMNETFLSTLEGLPERKRLRVHLEEELHEKGILGDGYYLSGSMNFTFAGITIYEEVVHFITDPAEVALNRVILADRWGAEVE
jgi:hypothetical protein